MPSTKRLLIVADDYGISPSVSAGIRELAKLGRISASGAMTLMPSWPREAPALLDPALKIEIGLHFTLTDQRPLGAMPILAPSGRLPSIGTLLKRALAGAVPEDEVAAEFSRQLDAFESALGRPPAFIDGHQHVHLLRGVRPVVLRALDGRLDPARCWLRDCSDRPSALLARGMIAKAGLIAALGWPLHMAARARGLATNHGFSGFYDSSHRDLDGVFDQLLARARDGHLLMLHPGHVDAELMSVDTLTRPRQREWDLLAAETFPERLAALGFTLTVGVQSWQTPPS